MIPDDVKQVVTKVLSHRIILSAEAEFEGISKEKIIDYILSKVEVPAIFVSEKITIR